MSEKTISVGILGCGGRISGIASRLVKEDPAIRIVALHDISPESVAASIERCAPDAVAYDSVEALLAHTPLDWVLVGSYNAIHRQHVVPALDAGKDVFCEKPLATTVTDTLAIVKAHQASGRQLIVGFTLRFSPFYRSLKALLDEGKVGQIMSFEFNETLHPNHGAAMHGNWRRHRNKGGSFIMEKCCHDLDLANWLIASRPQRVASFGGLSFFKPGNEHHIQRLGKHDVPHGGAIRKGVDFYLYGMQTGHFVGNRENVNPFTDDKDVIDHQVAILEYENGVKASFHLNTHAAIQERRFYICGTEGAIRADVITGRIEVQRVGWETEVEIIDPGASGGHGGGDEVLSRELADAMLKGFRPNAGIQDGINATVAALGIDQALDTGSVVDLSSLWAEVVQL